MITSAMRRAPPLTAIEAFLAAAESGSFRAAADVLSLSAPAVTRRIQALERHAGGKLFDRHAGGAILTTLGRELLARLGPAMGGIRAAMAPAPERKSVRLRISRSLAALWLVSRLARCPGEVALDFRADVTLEDLRTGAADLGIFFGDCAGSGLVVAPLLQIALSVVSAPLLADGRPAPERLDDLSYFRLLTLSNPPGLWRRLLPEATEFMTFDGIHPMFEAAAQGLGVAPGIIPLVEPYLANGRLIEASSAGARQPAPTIWSPPNTRSVRRLLQICAVGLLPKPAPTRPFEKG